MALQYLAILIFGILLNSANSYRIVGEHHVKRNGGRPILFKHWKSANFVELNYLKNFNFFTLSIFKIVKLTHKTYKLIHNNITLFCEFITRSYNRSVSMCVGGNPCTKPDEPFPCRNSDKCIPLMYLCDDNQDCDDGYDEDPAVCTAGLYPTK